FRAPAPARRSHRCRDLRVMNAPVTHQEIEELLGAYALDAVDTDERDLVDAHLAGCPRCASEVAGYRETAAMLAAHGGGRAPDGSGFVMAGSMPALPEGRTYQLWALKADDTKISLGVLGPRPGVTAFKMVGDVIGFAISDEAGSGAESPTSTPVAVALVRG